MSIFLNKLIINPYNGLTHTKQTPGGYGEGGEIITNDTELSYMIIFCPVETNKTALKWRLLLGKVVLYEF